MSFLIASAAVLQKGSEHSAHCMAHYPYTKDEPQYSHFKEQSS